MGMHYTWGRSQANRQCHVSYCSLRVYVTSVRSNGRQICRGHGMTPIRFHFNIHLMSQRALLYALYECEEYMGKPPFSTVSTNFRKESNEFERDVPPFNGASRKIQRQSEISDANECNLRFFFPTTRRLCRLTSIFFPLLLSFCLHYNSFRSFTVTSVSSKKLSDKLCARSF